MRKNNLKIIAYQNIILTYCTQNCIGTITITLSLIIGYLGYRRIIMTMRTLIKIKIGYIRYWNMVELFLAEVSFLSKI
jgi:hypothetical protein